MQVQIVATLCLQILLFPLLTGCTLSNKVEWEKFESQRIMNNLESQENALKILREIESEDPDAIYKGSSIATWIDRSEATVRVYRERKKNNESMWAY